jgi:hypothetical protein
MQDIVMELIENTVYTLKKLNKKRWSNIIQLYII